MKKTVLALAVGEKKKKKTSQKSCPQAKQWVNFECCPRARQSVCLRLRGRVGVTPAPSDAGCCEVLFVRLGYSAFGPRTLLLHWFQGLGTPEKTTLAGVVSKYICKFVPLEPVEVGFWDL